MGQFDIEVKQQLGREAFDYIVNRVKCGKMTDLSTSEQ